MSRHPGTSNRACGIRAHVKRNLDPLFFLGLVVSVKIPRNGMTCARPESLTAAKIVTRLISQACIPRRYQTVLNRKLAISRCKTPSVSPESAAPLVRSPSGLIDSGGERARQVGSHVQIGLFEVNVAPLPQREWNQLALIRNVRANQPHNR